MTVERCSRTFSRAVPLGDDARAEECGRARRFNHADVLRYN